MASQEERDRILAEYMASVQHDGADDDDEGDFDPSGVDDDDESDSSSVEQEDETGVVLTGTLTKKDNRLVYSGTWKESAGTGEFKFKLKSKQQKLPLHWDATKPTVSDSAVGGIPRMRSLAFEGFFFTMEGKKMRERDVNVTFTAQTQNLSANNAVNHKKDPNDDDSSDEKKPPSKPAALVVDEDSKMPSKPAAVEDEDSKMPSEPAAIEDEDSKMPSKPAAVEDEDAKMTSKPAAVEEDEDTKMPSRPAAAAAANGQVRCGVYGRGINDYGNFEFEGTYDGRINQLVCRKKYIESVGAAGAAVAVSSDDDDAGDDAVDYEELIALHQDAGLPVEELQKRYREQRDGSSGKNEGNKRQRIQESDEDEFDGF